MKPGSSIFMVYLLIVFSSCSNTRFLTKDQVLYTGRQDIKIINDPQISRTSSVKKYVKSITNHKVNNALFGRRVLPPVGLWVHNYMKVDDKKKFKSWFYKTLSSSPILISDINPELRADKIKNDLFDMGYFHTDAWTKIDTSKRNPNKARVSYFVNLAPPNYYNMVVIDTLLDQIDTLISKDIFMNQIRPGDQFNLDKLRTSRIGLSRRIQDKGYFYFIPDFIDLKADTTVIENKINLVIGKKNNLPESVLAVYRINNILINNSQGTDTVYATKDTTMYDGIKIISSGDILKPDIMVNSIFFRKGDIYSYELNQNTAARLNNLGIFKNVNISYIRNKTDSLSNLLDVIIDLIMSDNINLDFEADLATKSSGYFGPLFSTGISHINALKGAELLKVGLTGGFEWQWGIKSNDQIGTYSYQLGINTGLTLPGIIIPFNIAKKNSMLLQQRTTVNLELSLLNRTAFYKMMSVKTNLNYQWSRIRNIQHSFYPLYLNSVNLLATTPEFDSVVSDNIYIRKSFEEQFILGTKYEFSFNNTLTVRPNNFFFLAGISTSGNLLDLFSGMNKDPSERPYLFLNNVYSQYIKISTDFRYYRNGFNKSLVFRLYAGIGSPYGNSTALPYVEQFFSGGAYSIRAFTARYLGPGSFHSVDQTGYIDQSGDLKLESNLEYRFDMSKVLKGALFIETGNIWLVNEDVNRPGAKFDIHTFYDQLAVGTGFGLRFDFTFFVLRADFGFPLRNPYTTDGKNWLSGAKNIISEGIFNFAIGYPF
jgi:outer membrane protein assembly factor BamA